MSVHAKLEPANRRFSPRRRLRLGPVSKYLNREVLIHDISPTGLLLETSAKLRAFDRALNKPFEIGVGRGAPRSGRENLGHQRPCPRR